MYLSVRELLETSSLARAELIAGEKGLDNKFYIITPLDTPDIVEWLEGYELLVTQGYAIKEESPQRRNLIRDLHANQWRPPSFRGYDEAAQYFFRMHALLLHAAPF